MMPEPSALSPRHAIAALFVLALLGLVTLYDVVEGPDDARAERMAATPELPSSLGGAARFAADLRNYLGSRYAFRDWFIETNSMIKLRLFGHADYPEVMLGEDDFLFLASKGEGTIPLAQGADPFTKAEAEDWRDMFAAQERAFDAAGLPYLFILAPSKHSVYRDRLPDWLRQADWPVPGHRTDAVLRMAGQVLTLSPIDLREVFAKARATSPDLLYHRTDTHWNERGAALGLQAALSDAGIETDLPSFDVTETDAGGDLARMLGRQPQSSEQAPVIMREGWSCVGPEGAPLDIVTLDPLLPRQFSCKSDTARDLRVVAFIDSFGVSAIPFLASNFSDLTVFWQNQPDVTLATKAGADIVLNILVERRVQTADPASMVPDASN